MWLRPAEFSGENDAFCEALGRAIALAQNFEHSCKFVLGTWDLGKAHEDGTVRTRDERRAYSEKLMDRMLRAMVKRLRDDIEITQANKEAFEAARQARNYIAHEAAQAAVFVPPKFARRNLRDVLAERDREGLEKERAEMLLARMRREIEQFRKAVGALATADNVVSGWSYLIQEGDDRLPSIAEGYVQTVVAWVLEPLARVGLEGRATLHPGEGV